MAKIYARKVLAGEMSIDEVPARWRQTVVLAVAAQREKEGK